MDDDVTRLNWEGGEGEGEPDGMPALVTGSVFGQYKILRELGRGGMGEVYEVEHQVLGRKYAIKFIHGEVLRQPGSLERFRREARVMARLEHPGILQVDEYGETEGRPWLRMELIQGRPAGEIRLVSLGDWIQTREGRLESGEVRALLEALLEALEYAHEEGVVHRDLKPGNILLTENGIKVADFGLVQLAGENWFKDQVQLTVMRSLSIGQEATVLEGGSTGKDGSTRALLGTFDYMSPEQKEGGEVDARSDLYSVGIMTYRMLTGERSVGMRRPSELVKGLDPAWDQWVITALETRPERRFGSALQMREALPGRVEIPKAKGSTQTPFARVFPGWVYDKPKAPPRPEKKIEPESIRPEPRTPAPEPGPESASAEKTASGVESILDDLFRPSSPGVKSTGEGASPKPPDRPRPEPAKAEQREPEEPPPLPPRSGTIPEGPSKPKGKASRANRSRRTGADAPAGFAKSLPFALVGWFFLNTSIYLMLFQTLRDFMVPYILGCLAIGLGLQGMGFQEALHGRIRWAKLPGLALTTMVWAGLSGLAMFVVGVFVENVVLGRGATYFWHLFLYVWIGIYLFFSGFRIGFERKSWFRTGSLNRLAGWILMIGIPGLIYGFMAWVEKEIVYSGTFSDFFYTLRWDLGIDREEFLLILSLQMLTLLFPLLSLYALLAKVDSGKAGSTVKDLSEKTRRKEGGVQV